MNPLHKDRTMGNEKPQDEKHVHAYERMLERTREFLGEAGEELKPKLQHALDAAVEKATELGELTREEAEKIAEYLKRDLQSAGEYLAGDEAKELKDWLRMDLDLIEARILDALSLLVDPTKVELTLLAEQARLAEWHTGEVTGPGTLTCVNCGKELHFRKPGHIPPCPKCKGTVFRRKLDEE